MNWCHRLSIAFQWRTMTRHLSTWLHSEGKTSCQPLRLITLVLSLTLLSGSEVSTFLMERGFCGIVSRQVNVRVFQICTEDALPNQLYVNADLADNESHSRHVSIDKIWRRIETHYTEDETQPARNHSDCRIHRMNSVYRAAMQHIVHDDDGANKQLQPHTEYRLSTASWHHITTSKTSSLNPTYEYAQYMTRSSHVRIFRLIDSR